MTPAIAHVDERWVVGLGFLLSCVGVSGFSGSEGVMAFFIHFVEVSEEVVPSLVSNWFPAPVAKGIGKDSRNGKVSYSGADSHRITDGIISFSIGLAFMDLIPKVFNGLGWAPSGIHLFKIIGKVIRGDCAICSVEARR